MKTPARYIPQGSMAIRIKNTDGVVYYKTEGRISAIAYRGRCSNHSWHYTFRSLESLAKKIAEFRDELVSAAKFRAERDAKRNAFRHTLIVGDVLKSSWGY